MYHRWLVGETASLERRRIAQCTSRHGQLPNRHLLTEAALP